MSGHAPRTSLRWSLAVLGSLCIAGVAIAGEGAHTLAPNGGFLSSYYRLLPSPVSQRSLLYVAPDDRFHEVRTVALRPVSHHFHALEGRGACDLERLDAICARFDAIIREALIGAGYRVADDATESHDTLLRIALTNANSRTGVSMQIPLTYLKKFDHHSISVEAELLDADGRQLMAVVTQLDRSIQDWSNFPHDVDAEQQMLAWAARLVEALDHANELAGSSGVEDDRP